MILLSLLDRSVNSKYLGRFNFFYLSVFIVTAFSGFRFGVGWDYMSYYEAVAYTIDGLYEGFLFTTYDIKQFIDSLELNNKSNKQYDDNEYFDMYKYLIARELPYMEKLSNKK